MKNQSLTLITFLIFILMFSACSPADSIPKSPPQPTQPPPSPTATNVPTLEPTVLPTATLEPTTIPIPTLPPADITITFEGKMQCTYDGPEPIPAAESLTVNWYVNSTEDNWYGLLATIVGEGHTKEDLLEEARNPFPPPSWSEHVGNLEGPPASSLQGTIQAPNGPLRGPIYFICWAGNSWDSLKPVAILGPFEVQ